MSQAEFLTNLFLCAAALTFAAHRELAVRKCALAFFAGWLCYVSAWAADIHPALVSPAVFVERFGWDVRSVDIWIVADVIAGLIVMELAASTWWGRALWISYIAQGAWLILYKNDVIGWATYEPVVTGIFRGQVAIFILLGARHVGSRVVGLADYGRHALDQDKAARKAKAR